MINGIGQNRPQSVLIADAAILLGVSRRTVYYRIRDGRLRTVRTRGGSQRVLISSIQALLSGGRAAAGDGNSSEPGVAGTSEAEALAF